jgi:hypothetical protein
MSASIFGEIYLSPSSLEPEIIRLRELEGWHGMLSDIIEPYGEDIILAEIGGHLIELPKYLSATMWGLMGQPVRVGCFDGQVRVGRST